LTVAGFVPDTTDPEIGNFDPAPGTEIRTDQSLGFDITDDGVLSAALVWVSWTDPETDEEVTEVIHDGDTFRTRYTNAAINTRTVISGGYRFSVRRRGGWPQDRAGNNVPISFEFLPVDPGGNLGVIT
jgi:hypothetical protein